MQVTRHAGAPFAAGETLDGTADLEVDIASVVQVLNGNVENDNVKSGANISGTKLANNSIPATKVATSALTVTQMAATAIVQHQFATSTSTASMTTSTTFVNVPSIATITVTAGSTLDVAVIHYQTFTDWTSGGLVNSEFGFSINGTDVPVTQMVVTSDAQWAIVSLRWASVLGATSAIQIVPRYRRIDGTSGAAFVSPQYFDVTLIPVK